MKCFRLVHFFCMFLSLYKYNPNIIIKHRWNFMLRYHLVFLFDCLFACLCFFPHINYFHLALVYQDWDDTHDILWFAVNSCLLFLSNDTIRYLPPIQHKREFVQNLLNFRQNNHWHCSVVPDHCCREKNESIRLWKVKHMINTSFNVIVLLNSDKLVLLESSYSLVTVRYPSHYHMYFLPFLLLLSFSHGNEYVYMFFLFGLFNHDIVNFDESWTCILTNWWSISR